MKVGRVVGKTAVALFGVLLIGCVGFSALAGPEVKEEFSAHQAVAPNAKVAVTTVNGYVKAEPSDTANLDLRVVKRVRGVSEAEAPNYLAQIVVDVQEQADGLAIVVRQPKSRRGVTYGADVVVKVPAQGRIALHTTNGGIEASGLRGTVEAATVNGSVTCSGPVTAADLRTVNGSITGEAGQGEFSARTTNGNVTVKAPKDGSFVLHAATVNGSVENGFGIPVEGKIANKHADGTVGQGGPHLSAVTVNGHVEVMPSAR